MRIVITSIVDLKKSQHSRLHQIVKHLSKKHDLTVLSINDWWKGKQANLELYSKDFDEIFERINIRYLTKKKISPVLQELSSIDKAKRVLKEDFDVHLNYNTLVLGYLIAKEIKTVYDMSDDLGAMIGASPQIPWVLRPFGVFLGDFLIKKNIKASEKVTTTTKTLVKSYNIPKDRCEIIPNGVDTSLFRNHENAKNELGFNGFTIGYVGVLREWVDLEPVFAAVKQLDEEIKLIIVGREGRFEEHVNLSKKYGILDRVVFAGMVPYSQVPKYISAMDVCLIPFRLDSITENALPLKLFEYLACEKPVISAELPGVKTVAGNVVAYASKVEEYKERITELYRNEELRNRTGKAGRRLVEKNYDWSKIIKRLERALLEASYGTHGLDMISTGDLD